MLNNEPHNNEKQIEKTTIHWITCLPTLNSSDKSLHIAVKETELTISKCLKAPVIAEISKTIGAMELIKSVREIILNTAQVFKFSENMDVPQATILATDLISFFKHDTLEDIVLMFKMIRQGQLGSGKGRLDNDVMFNVFIPAYMDKKAEEREKQSQNDKRSHDLLSGTISEKTFQKLEELSKKLSANRVIENSNPVVNHHMVWLKNLNKAVEKMSLEQLQKELKTVEQKNDSVFEEAAKIYKLEISKR